MEEERGRREGVEDIKAHISKEMNPLNFRRSYATSFIKIMQ
jgi:hypothetical protein